jgi:hypothetical protein
LTSSAARRRHDDPPHAPPALDAFKRFGDLQKGKKSAGLGPDRPASGAAFKPAAAAVRAISRFDPARYGRSFAMV